MSKKKHNENDVDAAREYVEAMLDFELYAERLFESIKSGRAHG